MWWLKGGCFDVTRQSYVADFRFYVMEDDGEPTLVMLRPPYPFDTNPPAGMMETPMSARPAVKAAIIAGCVVLSALCAAPSDSVHGVRCVLCHLSHVPKCYVHVHAARNFLDRSK